MKYLLFGFDDYDSSGNDLIAISQSLDEIIKYAESHTYEHWMSGRPCRFSTYDIYELIDGVGCKLVWSNEKNHIGEIIKVAFLTCQSSP